MSAHRAIGPALAILVFSVAAQAQDNDLPKFAGTWTVTAAELGGEKATELVGATFDFGKESAKFTQKKEDGTSETDTHPFKVDSKGKRIVLYQTPDPMDPMADAKAGMQRGIYKFKDASTIYLCLTPPDATEFPKTFVSKTEDNDFLLLKLERGAKTVPATEKTAALPPSPGAKK